VSEWRISEQELGRINRFLQSSEDQLIHNCLTRTAQESKLFPIMPYLQLSFFEAYYRFPDLLRTASEVISPEEAGHRARNATCHLGRLTSWGISNFYFNGRTELIKLGLVRPEDNLEDLWTIVDWHERFASTYHRRNAHVWTLQASDTSQDHEERVLQVFEADAFEVNDALCNAATRFLAVGTQYSFLANCESRMGLQSVGPYRLGGQRLMHTRDFLNLSECDYAWLDEVGAEIPYNNLTAVIITDGVAVEINDFATAYTTPEHYQDCIVGVGLYTSDFLCDRYVPVGMDSRRELVDTLESVTEAMKRATARLYRRFSAMSFDQMVEAGIHAYFQAAADPIHMAGLYAQHDWELIDDRTRRLWELYSEEYSLDSYVSNMAALDGRQGAENEYYLSPVPYRMWRSGGAHDELPSHGRVRALVPAYVLNDHDYSRRANPNGIADVAGSSALPPKKGSYTFACGRLTEDEMNRAARDFTSPLLQAPWRNYDDSTVKYRWQHADVDALYRYTQKRSRLLRDRGSSLVRADLERIRSEAGERPWSKVRAGAAPRPLSAAPRPQEAGR
jgi:hypothetical protein